MSPPRFIDIPAALFFWGHLIHSDLNDQNLFHSTIDAPQGVAGMSKNLDDQTEVYSGELDC